MARFPYIPGLPDDNPLILSEEEKQELARFNSQLSKIQGDKITYLREIARRKGITASTLKELKSKSGKPFVEVKSKRTFGQDYRTAAVKGEVPAELKKLNLPMQIRETAYLCHEMYSKKKTDSCGWVKGNPIARSYDDIGILSGSAGTQFYCKICNKMIGDHVTIRS